MQHRSWQKDTDEKVGSAKTETYLNKDGKLTLTTKIPSLETYSFNLDVGLDPQTMLPYAAGSVSYEFYKYKLKTKHGFLELTGTLTLKNTFTPYVKTGICQAAIPASRGLSETNQLLYNNKENTAAIIIVGSLFGVGAPITAAATASLGLVSFATASNTDEFKYRESIPFKNKERTIQIIFKGYPLIRSTHV